MITCQNDLKGISFCGYQIKSHLSAALCNGTFKSLIKATSVFSLVFALDIPQKPQSTSADTFYRCLQEIKVCTVILLQIWIWKETCRLSCSCICLLMNLVLFSLLQSMQQKWIFKYIFVWHVGTIWPLIDKRWNSAAAAPESHQHAQTHRDMDPCSLSCTQQLHLGILAYLQQIHDFLTRHEKRRGKCIITAGF